MKRILLLLLFLATSIAVQAQRPQRVPMAGIQPGGERITIYKSGNAHVAFYTTEDGYVVLHEPDGGYYYARIGAKGLEATAQQAHNPSERSDAEQDFVADVAITAAQAYASPGVHRSPLKASARTENGLGEYGKPANGVVSSIGEITIPVIMVEFADRPFQETTTIEKVTRYLNEEGYHDEINTVGSVRDYFVAQSNNMFRPSFNVVAKVKAAKNYAYYGQNQGKTRDVNIKELIKSAIDSAVVKGVDFSTMLVNNRVPLVSILFAGPGEHNSYEDGCENYLWAHFNSSLSYTSPYGGPKFASYFIGDELYQRYASDGATVIGSRFEGMGVFCHEFGHALGLPDFYETANGDGVVDFWSVMDYGQYWKNGFCPIGYSAYERNFMGWLQINDLESDQQVVTIYPLGDSENRDKQAYRIVNPANKNEYFILENRQPGLWYPEQLGTGLLIYHVDYVGNLWSGNTLNRDMNHPRFQVFPADNVNQVYSDLRQAGKTSAEAYEHFQGDLFPGSTSTTTIATFPVFTGSAITAPCYNIAVDNNRVLTLQYLDLPQPAGKFVRIKSNASGLYVGAAGSGSQPMVEDVDAAGVYYVTPDNKLISLQQGLFLSDDDGFPCDDYAAAGSVFDFGVSVVATNATAGTYCIRSQAEPKYFKTSADGLAVSDDGNDAQCEFVLEEVTELPLNINTTTGYTTLCLPTPFNVPDDVTVLYVSHIHDNLLTITETGFSNIAGNVPVILYKEGGGKISISVANEGQSIEGNLLMPTEIGGTKVSAGQKACVYALNDEATSGSFRLLNDTDRGIASFKAYYMSNAETNAPQHLYFDENALTGIASLVTNASNAIVYDLQGRRINPKGAIPAGVYILKNGNRSQKVTIR